MQINLRAVKCYFSFHKNPVCIMTTNRLKSYLRPFRMNLNRRLSLVGFILLSTTGCLGPTAAQLASNSLETSTASEGNPASSSSALRHLNLLQPSPTTDLSQHSTDDISHVEVGGKWKFVCPRPFERKRAEEIDSVLTLAVVWQKNNETWLAINNAELTEKKGLNSVNKRIVLPNKHIVTATLNAHRYSVSYDETVGEFSLTVDQAIAEDGGNWSCQVTMVTKKVLRQGDGSVNFFNSTDHYTASTTLFVTGDRSAPWNPNRPLKQTSGVQSHNISGSFPANVVLRGRQNDRNRSFNGSRPLSAHSSSSSFKCINTLRSLYQTVLGLVFVVVALYFFE